MTHQECYGGMVPGPLVEPVMSHRIDGKVFAYKQTRPGGIGIPNRETFVAQEAWDDCIHCDEFEHCYKLCMAKLCFDHAIGR